jgi:hypothetical protein
MGSKAMRHVELPPPAPVRVVDDRPVWHRLFAD